MRRPQIAPLPTTKTSRMYSGSLMNTTGRFEAAASRYNILTGPKKGLRLICLFPGSANSTIKGSFVYAELGNSCPSYIALSYTWGEQTILKKIVIGGHGDIMIGENLWSFLRLQTTIITMPTLFWIDAICIDQQNINERNHQVGLMKHIYASADQVFLWLGKECNGSDKAMSFIRNQATKPPNKRGQGYRSIWPIALGQAIHDLCERPYWKRMWIIQEILHSNSITVWCGSQSIAWEALEKLYLKLKTLEEANWLSHHKLHTQVAQSPAAMMLWQRAHWRHEGTPVPQLQTLIDIFRDFKCSDIKDKVFALVGMATIDSAIVPNYALTTKEIYFGVMRNVQEDKEQFGPKLSQTLGLSHRELNLPWADMIAYRREDVERLVVRARRHDWTNDHSPVICLMSELVG
ncbi:heterokaryon incompatibility protein-domain-containing protein [Nemania sp. FL0916]|nr:heterokaryon incompatibility protein-domain-containing protein [Nemania sp. FL0916]